MKVPGTPAGPHSETGSQHQACPATGPPPLCAPYRTVFHAVRAPHRGMTTRNDTVFARCRELWSSALRWALVALALVLQTSVGTAVLARETATVPGEPDPFADVVPGALAPAERAAEELSAYRLDVAIDEMAGTIGGEMELTWRNPAAKPLEDVWFRLFPNAFYYGEGELTVANVTVDGEPVLPALALDQTALGVPLPSPVARGERAEIAREFTTTVPADSTGSYGIFSRDTRNGAWVLADWYPILAVSRLKIP